MKRIDSRLLLILFYITSLEAHRINYDYYLPIPRFDIFHPKGITVSYPRLWGIDRFEIRIYLNKPYFSDDVPCEICLNTTAATSYGQFVVKDDNALVKKRDNLKYKVLLHMSDGCVYQIKKQFNVKDNPIFRLNTPTTCTNEKDQSKIAKLEKEVTLLENIVQDLLQNTAANNNGSEVTKNLYLNYRPASVILEPPQLYDFTLKVLQDKLPGIDWKTALVSAFYYNDGVGFEVKTLLDKLKALQMTKHFEQETVKDLDQLGEIEDNDNGNNNSEVIFHGVRSGVGKV